MTSNKPAQCGVCYATGTVKKLAAQGQALSKSVIFIFVETFLGAFSSLLDSPVLRGRKNGSGRHATKVM